MAVSLPVTLTFSGDMAHTPVSPGEFEMKLKTGVGGYNLWATTSGGHDGYSANAFAGLTLPDGTSPYADIDSIIYGWNSSDSSGSFATTLAATFAAYFFDAHLNGDYTTGIDTPRGRPNHLRQVHGVYQLRFDADITWDATANSDYEGDDGSGNIVTKHGTVTESGVTSTWVDDGDHSLGRKLVYNPADPSDDGSGLPYHILSFGFTSTFIYDAGNQCGSMSCTMPGSSGADLGAFNDGDAGQYVTYASGLSVDCYVAEQTGTEEYGAHPRWQGTLSATARDYAGSGLVLHGNPAVPGGPATAVTPWTGAGALLNLRGPDRHYAIHGGGYTPNYNALLYFALDPARQRDQEDWYGPSERAYVAPPESCSWSPFTLTHAPSVAVDDMVSSHPDQTVNGLGGDYDWHGGDGVTLSVTGAYRRAVVGASPADPRVYRSLQSDWHDCAADPSNYRDHCGDADVTAYITNRKTWYNVRRKVRDGADVCDWGNHRWLKITGKADASRTFTLRITADNVTLSDNFLMGGLATDSPPGDRTILYTAASVTVDVPGLAFSTSDTDVYVDLAEAGARIPSSLVHVTAVEFRELEAGGTYDFKAIALASGAATGTHTVNEGEAAWGYWSGVPHADDACLVPVVDGRVCCLQDAFEPAESPYVLTWCQRQATVSGTTYSPRGADETKTFAELAQDAAMQEGFTVSDVTDPPGDFSGLGYAIFADAGWNDGDTAFSASVKCEDMLVPIVLYETWEATSVLRARLPGLCFDGANHWPASGIHVNVEGHKPDDTYVDMGDDPVSDANGAWVAGPLPHAGGGQWLSVLDAPTASDYATYDMYRATGRNLHDGGGDDVSTTSEAHNRSTGQSVPALSGAVHGAAGRLTSLAVSENGQMARAWETATGVRVERRTRDGGTVEILGEKTGKQPSVAWSADGEIVAAYVHGTNDVKLWGVTEGTEMSITTGTYPQLRYSRNGAFRIVTAWHDGNHYCRVFDSAGNDLHGEVEMKAGTPETDMAVDWRLDGTLEAVYSDGTGVQIVTSADNGATWS